MKKSNYKKNIRNKIVLLILIFTLIFFNLNIYATEINFLDIGKNKSKSKNINVELKNWKTKIEILKNGDLKISEIWDAEYNNNITTIFRNFGRGVNKDFIKNVSVYEYARNNKIPFNRTNFHYKQKYGNFHSEMGPEKSYEIAWGIDKKENKGKYEINYTLSGTALKNKDNSQIFHRFIGDNQLPTKNLEIEIFSKDYLFNEKNTIFFGRGGRDIVGKFEDGKIKIKSKKPLIIGENVEYRLILPKDALNVQKINNYIIEDNLNNEDVLKKEKELHKWALDAKIENLNKNKKILKYDMVKYICAISILMIIIDFLLLKTLKQRKAYKYRKSYIKDFKYYNEVPEDIDINIYDLKYFLDKRLKMKPTPSNILQGIVLKANFLKILEIKNIESLPKLKEKRIKYVLNLEKYNEATSKNMISDVERTLLNIFFSKADENNEVNQNEIIEELKKDISYYNKKEIEEDQKTEKKLIKEGYVEKKKILKKYISLKNLFKLRGKLLYLLIIVFFIFSFSNPNLKNNNIKGIPVIGIKNQFPIFIYSMFIILVLCIIFLIFMYYKYWHYGYTAKGMQLENEVLGFRRYIKDFSKISDHDENGLIIWEKILIYATIFGLAKKVLKHLKIVNSEVYNDLNNKYFLAGFYDNAFNTTQMAQLYGSTSNNGFGDSYGGFFDGGSFGGGGFGGGSGGGR